MRVLPGVAVVDGYQQFVATRHTVCCGTRHPETVAKARLLASWMTPRFLAGRSVLDLGGNAGFYSFWALQAGARQSTVIDIDDGPLDQVRVVTQHLGFDQIAAVKANVDEWEEPADVVFALALVHWAYSCTAVLGSMTAFVRKVAELTRYLALVEWIAPEDPLLTRFGHTDWNRDDVSGPYDEGEFLEALRRSFCRVESVGEVSPTRRLWAAFRTEFEVDLSCPLPALDPAGKLLSSRNLTRYRGVDHWSQLYETPDEHHLIKQASLDLAEREHVFLNRLAGPHFPRASSCKSGLAASVVTIERARGDTLARAGPMILKDEATFRRFFLHCLDILTALEDAGIQHRDIRAENLIIREGMPVLIDFGWASSRDLPRSAPPHLGVDGRPPDGSFCDVFSMGRMLEGLKGSRFPEFDPILRLMTEPESRCRLTDIPTLRILVGRQAQEEGEVSDMGEEKGMPGDAGSRAIAGLTDKAAALSQRGQALESRLADVEAELARKGEAVAALSAQILELEAAAASHSADLAGEQEHAKREQQRATEIDALLLERTRQCAEIRHALDEKESELSRLRPNIDSLRTELTAAQVALAETGDLARAQAAQIAYLEKEVNARFWRKAVAYARRCFRGL